MTKVFDEETVETSSEIDDFMTMGEHKTYNKWRIRILFSIILRLWHILSLSILGA